MKRTLFGVRAVWVVTCVVGAVLFLGLWLYQSYSIKSFPNLPGTIVYLYSGEGIFVPGIGMDTVVSWEQKDFWPDVLCQTAGDTLMIASMFPRTGAPVRVPPTFGQEYYYKLLPLTQTTIPIDILSDTSQRCEHLDFDKEFSRYLCLATKGRGQELLLMDKDFKVLKNLSEATLHQSEWGLINAIFFVHGGIECGYPSVNKFYPLRGDSIGSPSALPEGRLLAVSNDNTKLLITAGYMHYQSMIHDMLTGKDYVLPTSKELLGGAFSPDDHYLAYSVNTNNLMDEVELFICDTESKATKFTGINDARGLGAWVRGKLEFAASNESLASLKVRQFLR